MSSGWTSWIRTAAAGLALAAGVWSQGAGAAEVKNVTAQYAWPWRAEILFEVVGDLPTSSWLVVSVTDRANNATYTAAANALAGDTGLNKGVHHVTWELDKQGVKIQSTNVVFTVRYDRPTLYCVVDLSGGKNATSYPVTYLDGPPSGGFNTDEYKTTKMALRLIEPGTFTMGSPANEMGRCSDDEVQHQVTLTKAYYIGIFEVTQGQWEKVTGYNPSAYDSYSPTWSVNHINYVRIRGSANWPTSSAVGADSFMGKLRAGTGLTFDLPTEAQWEYACRAGTATALNSGKNLTSTTNKCANLAQVGRYDGNPQSDGYPWYGTSGGKYQPNAWGLYDMHGNMYEYCLDWYTADLGTAAVTDPKGPSSGTSGNYRVMRGGSYESSARECRSAFRAWWDIEWGGKPHEGCRPVINLSP